MRTLELLAPARNTDIGIAAIDCGADAVYIAGPGFGARKAAGNSIDDIRRLCVYAHRFGVKIFLTVNTIIYEDEVQEVHNLMLEAQDAGVDAFIVQDPLITGFKDINVPLHASTQCSIRTPERARELEALGFERLVLERELSIEQIRKIREAVSCELEVFVHGALCVCYSGKCNLSEHIDGRSANRGECIQACRSLYNLEDASGKVLVENKALLSLKDLRLKDRLEELAGLDIISFKIEGRLKNASYVRNVVREYSLALDRLIGQHPGEYRRASFGKVTGGFTPDSTKTFNRGYTTLFLDGERGRWSSMDAPKSMGEMIGKVIAIRDAGQSDCEIELAPYSKGLLLSNGDGFAFLSGKEIVGFRGDVCSGNRIRCKKIQGLRTGDVLFRNINAAFEKQMDANPCKREIPATISLHIRDGYTIVAEAVGDDGKTATLSVPAGQTTAENRERMLSLLENQLSKKAGIYSFSLKAVDIETSNGTVPFISAAGINSIRRDLADKLESTAAERQFRKCFPSVEEIGPSSDWYELTHDRNAELMRSKYCIRFELGLCPVRQKAKESGPLFITNNGRKLALGFDCRNCEMTVKEVI